MNNEFHQKFIAATDIIEQAISKFGNKLYVSYSGGKDSKALLILTKMVSKKMGYIDMLVIHNEHPGEVIDNNFGTLVVKAPKTNVPAFLKMVDLEAQIDGTRRDEDKTVIFDGVEIHRSKMPSYKTNNGVFGLSVYYPLINWTEEDIFKFLKDTKS